MRQRRFDDPERRVDVGLHRRVEILAGDVEDRLPRLLPRRVADQDVEPAELAARRRATSSRQNASWRRSPGMATALAPLALDQLDYLARIGLLVRQVVDRDVGPLAGEGDGGGAAHARISAGDQGLPAGEPARAVIARLAMVGPRLHLAGEPGPGLRLRLERRLRVLGRRIDHRCCRRRSCRLGGGRGRGGETCGRGADGTAA